MDDSFYMRKIDTEFEKINERWLTLSKKITYGCTAAAFLIELMMGLFLSHTNLITSCPKIYVIKYILIPSFLNLLLVILIQILDRKFKDRRIFRRYTVSLGFSAICFVLFFIHNVFPVLRFLFVIPILLTVVYGDYKIITVTSLFSMVCLFLGELVIFWDPDKPSVLENDLELTNFLISLAIMAGLYIICLVLISFEKQKNSVVFEKELEHRRLKQELLKDGLTGIYNRAALTEALGEIRTSGHSYIFVMIDLDNFKNLNDTCGHLEGDKCLKDFSLILKNNCFPHPVFRFGGDEFCILFRDETMDFVVHTCHGIQEHLKCFTSGTSFSSLSASFGAAQYRTGMKVNHLLRNADKALYRAKDQKNCIHIYNKEQDSR